MTTLHDLAVRHATDKATHGYGPTYERYFAPFRDERFNMLEIGVRRGSSIKMWLDYFPHATVYGVDIEDGGHKVSSDRYIFTMCDVSDTSRFPRSIGEPPLRVVVDDGSHKWADIDAAYRALWPLVEPGGFYVVEDTFVQWWDDFRAGGEGPDMLTRFVQRFNSDRCRVGTAGKSSIEAVHYHSGLMFVEKRR